MEKSKITVFQDEDAYYTVISGTNDRTEAEKALREQEEEWYGKNHEQKPLSMDGFSAADIYIGTKNGEEGCYWGIDDPSKYFDSEYTKQDGFIHAME